MAFYRTLLIFRQKIYVSKLPRSYKVFLYMNILIHRLYVAVLYIVYDYEGVFIIEKIFQRARTLYITARQNRNIYPRAKKMMSVFTWYRNL